MKRLDAEGRLVHTRSGLPRFKRFLDEVSTVPVKSVWTDLESGTNLGSRGRSQRSPSLIARMITSATNVNDVILDPICGDGTTLAVAHMLGRRWIGLESTHSALSTVRARLRNYFGPRIHGAYKVDRVPSTLEEASALAMRSRSEFISWTLGMVGAERIRYQRDQLLDGVGFDGRLSVTHEGREPLSAVFSVEANRLGPNVINRLETARRQSKADFAILLSMFEPSRSQRAELSRAEVLRRPSGRYPRLQLLTLRELLDGVLPQLPEGTGRASLLPPPAVASLREKVRSARRA
jgi:hypothetical protein